MNIYQRALTSISKRKGKTLILFMVVFLLGNLIAGAAAVYNATQQLETSMKEQLGAKARVDLDFMNLKQNEAIVPLTADQADAIGMLPEVKSVSYQLNTHMGSEKLKRYTQEKRDDTSNSIMISGSAGLADFANFSLVGSKHELPNEFMNGKQKIVEGRYPKASDTEREILISKKLAAQNALELGSEITLDHSLVEFDPKAQDIEVKQKESFTFKVVGIFDTADSASSNDPMASFMEEGQHNTLYTNYEFLAALDLADAKVMATFEKGFCNSVETCRTMVTPTYELTSPDVIDQFVEKANQLLNSKQFKIETTKDSFDAVAGSLMNMKEMSNTILLFGVGGSVLVLSLVLILFMRDRKHEFGIYQALGETKLKSMVQVLLEVILISVLAVSLALFTGLKLAGGLSQSMIQNQLKQQETVPEGNFVMSIGGSENQLTDITEEEIAKNFKVEISQEYVVVFYSIMLGTTLAATMVSSIYILRLKPREILL